MGVCVEPTRGRAVSSRRPTLAAGASAAAPTARRRQPRAWPDPPSRPLFSVCCPLLSVVTRGTTSSSHGCRSAPAPRIVFVVPIRTTRGLAVTAAATDACCRDPGAPRAAVWAVAASASPTSPAQRQRQADPTDRADGAGGVDHDSRSGVQPVVASDRRPPSLSRFPLQTRLHWGGADRRPIRTIRDDSRRDRTGTTAQAARASGGESPQRPQRDHPPCAVGRTGAATGAAA